MVDIFGIWARVKKFFTFRELGLLFLLVTAYLATRLIELDTFPIFTDEGIYIRWAKVAWKDPNWRFISLTDGKQPLHIWGMIPFFKLFPDSLLLAGRMFSVLSGFVALTGIVTLANYLFNKKVALIAGFMYVFTPMFLFYDRMALADSAVNAGFIWILFGSILLARTLRFDVALMFGITAGAALLTKSSTQMFLGLSALAPILTLHYKKKDAVRKIVTFYILFAIAAVIAFAMYNIQRLSPYLHFVEQKNATFVMPLSEFLDKPLSVVFRNIPLIIYYVSSEMAYMAAGFGVLGLGGLYLRNHRLAIYLTLWLAGSFMAIAFFGKTIFPRYLIFFASLLTVTAAYFIGVKKNERFMKGFVALFIVSVVYFDFTILFAHTKIPFPQVDRGQYIESFNAGWGVKDIIEFARAQGTDKPVILIGEGNFGVVSDMLEASVSHGENIAIKGYWPLEKASLMENQSALKDHHVYIVLSHMDKPPTDWPMKLVKAYPKPGGKSTYYLMELTPAEEPDPYLPAGSP